ncbi:hypothetical protein JHK85_001220 [Glycine max]|nr:hypothetical protein JHK85_001220 [Glycine max]
MMPKETLSHSGIGAWYLFEMIYVSAFSRALRHHFAKIKDADSAIRLEKIWVEEGLQSEQVALDFIVARSYGSFRDVETMLDQLSLLGKIITISLVHKLYVLPFVFLLTGVISDHELLDLLDLALSTDTSNTIVRAQELVRTRIDPLQLISQLENLIIDILVGKCELGDFEIKTRFCNRYSYVDICNTFPKGDNLEHLATTG